MGFVMPHVAVLAAAGCAFIALILQIVGVAAVGWASDQLYGGSSQDGLWKICGMVQGISLCTDWPAVPSVRAFGILGILAMAACVACIIPITFMSDKQIFGLLAPGAAIAGGLCALIEFSVYASETADRAESSTYSYEYCFALTIVACALCVIAAVLFMIGRRRG
ncbi:hypothetical protein BaRGS_00039978 [Batillaria attramentaria]|uniref:Uncharacterized protein n=1 Tax=Batillaria attramentaria TaxID=370345 RepID=A0ABD0J1W7_9CAEN